MTAFATRFLSSGIIQKTVLIKRKISFLCSLNMRMNLFSWFAELIQIKIQETSKQEDEQNNEKGSALVLAKLAISYVSKIR